MEEVHVRRFFVHVHHCGDDVFLADKICEIGCGFLEKASGFIGIEFVKKFFVRTDNQAAHMNRIFSDSLNHEQVVNAIFNGFGITRGAIVA